MSQRTLELILKARNETQGALSQLSGGLTSIRGILAQLGVALSAGMLVKMASDTIKANGALYDMSVKLGTTTEALSEYQYVAKMTGTELSSLTTAWRFMSRNIGEASTGNKEAAESFRALGIDLAALKGLAVDKQFESILASIRSIGDQAGRTQAAMDIFGRGGGEILALAGDFDKLRQEAQSLGVTLSSDMAKKFDDACDSVDRMKAATGRLWRELVSKVAPAIAATAQAATALIQGGDAMSRAAFPDYYAQQERPLFDPWMTGDRRGLGPFKTSYAPARPSATETPAAGAIREDIGPYGPGMHEYVAGNLLYGGGVYSAGDAGRPDVHAIIEAAKATADLAADSERARYAWELIESYGGETLATFTAMTDVAGALAGVGEAFGGQNERWVQGLRKVQQIYQSIYALVQAIRAMQTVFTAIGLQDGGAVPMAAGGAVRAARGYMIPDGQRGMDSRLILGQPGEVVIDRHTVQELQDFLGRARSASVSGFGLIGPRGRGGATVQFVNQFPMSRSEAMELGRRAAVATAEYERRFL